MKTEALLEKLFENTRSMLLVTDEQFYIRYISSSVEASFGLEAYSVIGRNAFDFVSEENREPWRRCLEETNNNMSSEISFVTPAGKELHFNATITNHVSNSEIRGLVVIMFDITETKQRRRQLERANHHLDHFIFKTIHDLRSPVHSSLGLMDLSTQSDREELDRHLGLIRANLLKMDSFIEEVSSYYMNEKLGIVNENIDFNALFREELDVLRNLPGGPEIDFTYDYHGTAELFSDPLRIKTILTNILSNSIKYCDPSKANRFVNVSVNVNERDFTISIKDNGLGIREEHLTRIFDIFFRSHAQIQGTGLGLYIVKDTVERLEGTIDVSSVYGEGTTFVITLPNLRSAGVLA